jgi:hypothetical protein
MLQTKLFAQLLKTTSALSLSAVLLGVSFATPTWAMETEDSSLENTTSVPKLKAYADLASDEPAPNVPALKRGDLILINTGHGMVRSCTRISTNNTETALFTNHGTFMDEIKILDEADYTAVITEVKLGSGKELVKTGEKGLPTLLDELNSRGTNIIPITSRGDDGKCGTREEGEVLSRTEKEFVTLNYHWKNWNKPVPFQNLNSEVYLQDNQPTAHGIYRLRNGIIYNTNCKAPHKSAAIVGIVNILKQDKHLPFDIYMIDGEETINQIAKDLKSVDLGIPLYLLSYSQPKAFQTPEDLKEFYIHRLGEKFENYTNQFSKIFYPSK